MPVTSPPRTTIAISGPTRKAIKAAARMRGLTMREFADTLLKQWCIHDLQRVARGVAAETLGMPVPDGAVVPGPVE